MNEKISILDVTKRPLPSFRQWLSEHSPGTQADDFEAFADLAARSQNQPLDHLTPTQASFGRMWMGACVAAVELCNMEAIKHDRPTDETISHLARAFAAACMYAFASAVKDESNPPWRSIARMMTEEFRHAAKTSADRLAEDFEADAHAPHEGKK